MGNGGWSTVRVRSEHREAILKLVETGRAASLASYIDEVLNAALRPPEAPRNGSRAEPVSPNSIEGIEGHFHQVWAFVEAIDGRLSRLETMAQNGAY